MSERPHGNPVAEASLKGGTTRRVNAVTGVNCPNCGAAVTVRGFGRTLTVVCEHCLSTLDAKDPNFAVLQTAQVKQRVEPLIPLGSRGTFHGVLYEVIGFQVRTITVDEVPYSWSEYLLFNPYHGYRYLTEYAGHWNFARTLRAIPIGSDDAHGQMLHDGEKYRHFQTAVAVTTFVLGEFPWRIEVGDQVQARDYIAPPHILSAEVVANEATWSRAEYMRGAAIWDAFKLPGRPPSPTGVFANQPSPYAGKPRRMWRLFALWICLLFMLLVARWILAAREQVFAQGYVYDPRREETSFVTPVFELRGRPANVELTTRTDLTNEWVYISYALINAQTGTAYDFGREISYYSGTDSDGAWTEGDRNDRVVLPAMAPGSYYLRVEPSSEGITRAMSFNVRVRRDVPSWFWFFTAFGLLWIPPLYVSVRAMTFEHARWQESDYGGGDASDDDESEDEEEE